MKIGGSICIALPQAFCNRHKLQVGNKIIIEDFADHCTVLLLNQQNLKKIELEQKQINEIAEEKRIKELKKKYYKED
jgi:hypothetical protein